MFPPWVFLSQFDKESMLGEAQPYFYDILVKGACKGINKSTSMYVASST